MARNCNVWCLVVVLSLLVAAASAYRTITTSVEFVSNEAGGRCQQEMQQARQRLNSCRQYLREGHRFETETENESGWREHFPIGCNQLERISEQCRCQAIKQVAEGQVQGELQGMEKKEMLRTAESLPSLCRIAPKYCKNIRGGEEQEEEVEFVF